MSWSYSSNFMGPAGLWWYEQNNIPYTEETKFSELFGKEITMKHYKQYAGGRIDCRCDNLEDPNYDRYGVELDLPIMEAESFNALSDWLFQYESEELNENVIQTFEEETGFKIRYFTEK